VKRRIALAAPLAVLSVALSGGCGGGQPSPVIASSSPSSQRDLEAARRAIAARKSELPTSAFTERVAVQIRFPKGGPGFEGRGAVAVDPGHAMRMIIVGPGGATALDVWITHAKYRFAIPPVDRIERGAVRDAGATKLPVEFFRFWFLRRFEGKVGFADATHVVVRDGDAATSFDRGVFSQGTPFSAERRVGSAAATIAWWPKGSENAPERAEYVGGDGVRVDVRILGREDGVPQAAAFDDPDLAPPETP